MFSQCVYIVFLCFAIELIGGSVKTWTKNTNFDNGGNWDLLRKPCAGDAVKFGNTFNGAILMNQAKIGKELVLPSNGQLIFGRNSEITFGSQDPACQAKEIRFKSTQWKVWTNPENWNSSDFTVSRDKWFWSPIPHSDRIPCAYDDVVFPPDSSFRVKLNKPLVVKSLTYNRKKLQTAKFRSFASSSLGSAQFKLLDDVRISNRKCEDVQGCNCGNDQPEVLSTICTISASNCPKIDCHNPIKPLGFCCKTCGAYVVFKMMDGFQIGPIKNLVNSLLNKPKFESCKGYLSRMTGNEIQFVTTDSGAGKASELAEILRLHLQADIDKVGMYRIAKLRSHSSGKWHANQETQQNSSGIAGKVVGILFAVLLIVAIIILAVFVYKKRKITSYGFVRFGTDNQIELELEKSRRPKTETSGSGAAKHAFHNPIYNIRTKEAKSKKLVEKPDIESKSEFENPMYTELED